MNKAPTKARRKPPPNYDDISDDDDEVEIAAGIIDVSGDSDLDKKPAAKTDEKQENVDGGDSDSDLDKKPAAKTDVKQEKKQAVSAAKTEEKQEKKEAVTEVSKGDDNEVAVNPNPEEDETKPAAKVSGFLETD